MGETSKDAGADIAFPVSGSPPPRADGKYQGRRALPSVAEQKRRQEWGKKWGKLVSDAVREALKGDG